MLCTPGLSQRPFRIIIVPIIADGEVIGSLMLLSHDVGARMTEIDLKVAETTAGLVGRQMEQ